MLHITNGLVIDPYSGLCEKKDILSEDGRILVIGTAEEAEECLRTIQQDRDSQRSEQIRQQINSATAEQKAEMYRRIMASMKDNED